MDRPSLEIAAILLNWVPKNVRGGKPSLTRRRVLHVRGLERLYEEIVAVHGCCHPGTRVRVRLQ